MNFEVSRKPISRKRISIAFLGVAMSLAGLAYVFKDILLGKASAHQKFSELAASVDRIRMAPLLASVAIYWLCVIVIRAFLVRHLLKGVGHLRVGQTYRYICIGFLANNILPLRAGEVARSVAIHRGARLPFTSVMGGLAVERMLDMSVLAVLAIFAIQVAPLPGNVRLLGIGLALVLGIAFAAMIVLSRRRRKELSTCDGTSIRSFIWNTWVRLIAGFSAMRNPRSILMSFGLALAIWIFALLTMMARLWAFDLPASLPVAIVLLTSLGFGVAVPSAPGYLGVYHAAVIFALEAFGIDPTATVAFAWFSWLLDIGISSIAGAVSLSLEGWKLGELKKQQKSALKDM